MVNDRKKKSRRLANIVLGVLFFLIIGFVLTAFFSFGRIPRGRLGIVMQGNPTLFVSWESDRSRFAVFVLPDFMQIEAIKGYGWYGLDALWKLDAMDRHGGKIYKQSIEDALATPIQWFVAGEEKSGNIDDSKDALSIIQRRLSFPSLFHSLLTGKTDITIFELFYVWNQMHAMGSDAMTFYDFQHGQILTDVVLPDETTVSRFDGAKYDALIENTLEDTPFRQEGMRIALYNTTGTPGIAQRVSRIIEHMGGFVVFVGNDDSLVSDECEVVGEKSALSSLTAQFFRTFYECSMREEQGEKGRADIIVRLGKGIEARYAPF